MSRKRPSGGCAAWRQRLSAPPLLAALACISLVWGLWTAPVSARPQNLRQLSEITNKLTETSVSYGAIPALYRPRYDRVQDADLNMSQEDVVFVVMLPGGPRIYPQRFMVWHQVVNELIDDVAYAVTYCPITGTLMAYNASMNGLNLIFDLEGRLYDGNSVLIDRNSGSLWLQETGMAFDGPLLGRGMPTIPVFWTTWGASMKQYFGGYSMWFAWYSLNPETFVIPGPGEVPADLLSLTPPGVDDPAGKTPPARGGSGADAGASRP